MSGSLLLTYMRQATALNMTLRRFMSEVDSVDLAMYEAKYRIDGFADQGIPAPNIGPTMRTKDFKAQIESLNKSMGAV